MNEKGQRLVLYGGLAGIILLAWAYLVYLATTLGMTNMGVDISMPSMQAWGATDTSLTFIMWVVMMVAMMTPSAAPVILTEWRDGKLGPLVMGMRHGLYCVGCCWLLMTLLFVGGVMNLAWVGLIAAYILVEKAAPARIWLSRISGIAAIAWGLWLVAGTVL